MVKELDFADNKKINYSEFIAATINAADFLTHEKLEAIFKSFDIETPVKLQPKILKTRFLNLVRRFRMMKLILL